MSTAALVPPDVPYRLHDAAAPAAAVFASTHSGRFYAPALRRQTRLSPDALSLGEDPYVDALIARAPARGVPTLGAVHARAYVDLNRDPAELDPDLFAPSPPATGLRASERVAAGLGVIPRLFAPGQSIYPGRLPLAEAATRIAAAHTPYHAALARLVERARARHGFALLVDFHSMPGRTAPGLPDIVIGDLNGRSAAGAIVDLIESALNATGFTTARNAPYAGAYTIERHGIPRRGLHAVQLEFDRGLYLDAERRPVARAMAELAERVGAFADALVLGLDTMAWPGAGRVAAE